MRSNHCNSNNARCSRCIASILFSGFSVDFASTKQHAASATWKLMARPSTTHPLPLLPTSHPMISTPFSAPGVICAALLPRVQFQVQHLRHNGEGLSEHLLSVLLDFHGRLH